MKRILLFACVLLLGVGFAPAVQPVFAASAAAIASDSFGRTVNNAWGNADKGGTYSLIGSAANFAVNNSAGSINIPSNGGLTAYLASVQTTEADMSVRFKTNKIAVGGTQFVSLMARRIGSGDSYLGKLRLLTDGTVQVEIDTVIAGKTTRLGSRVTATNFKYSAGQSIRVRMVVLGTSPTAIRLKAWADGQAEPSDWQVQATDGTSSLQTAGSLGIQVRAANKVTNRPILVSFNDLQATDPSSTTTTGSSIYWGALVNGEAPSPGNLASGGVFPTFEQRAGKKMSILHWGQPWQMGHQWLYFQTSYFDAVRSRGYIPMLDWGSFNNGSGVNQSSFQLNDVYNGTYDWYIKQWAQAAKAWGHPFFLRFDWEMNGNWQFPWSEQLNGNKAGDYVKMWRHVHDIFKNNGATNVTWVWCPNIAGTTTRSMKSLYPGDAYVDWTCLDGYNKYPIWLRFNQVYGANGINWLHNSYDEITKLAPTKPLMIGEIASLEAGDGGTKKAAWIQDTFATQLPKYYPKIKAVVWFNWNDGSSKYSFPIESSQKATNAFAAAIKSGYYASNNFANLNTSPIPPIQ